VVFFISVDDLMEEAVERAMKEIVKRREQISTMKKCLKIAEQVGIGAIRYYIAQIISRKAYNFSNGMKH
jgi:arginyl-tRNA synthetase